MNRSGAASVIAALSLLLPVLSAGPVQSREISSLSFDLIDNRVFVPAMVEGHGPYSFVLDTGAANWNLSLTIAEQLGMKSQTQVKVDGAGEDLSTVNRIHVDDIRLGAASFGNLTLDASAFTNLINVIGFKHFDGIAGQDVFQRYVVDINFDARAVRLLTFDDYVPPTNALSVPFEFYDGFIPLVQGRVGGVEGKFIVDLGDRSSLTLFGPFWRAHQMDKSLAPTIDALTGYGVGGPIRGLVVRAGRFEMGSAHIDGVVARLSLQRSGGFADASIAGSVGTGILKRFHITFDYARRRILLIPSRAYAVADCFDRSGLWLGRGEGGMLIYDVVAGSPADKAGLRVGDVVTEVDGKPATQIDLFALRARFADPSSDRVHIAYERQKMRGVTGLKLRDQLPG